MRLELIFPILLGWLLAGLFVFWLYIDNSLVFDEYRNKFFDPCKPTWLYDNYKVNVVGVIILTIFFNVILLPLAVVYWSYELIRFIMTAGRKK